MFKNSVLEKDIEEIISNEKLFRAFDGSTVLITGGTGFIGSMLLRAFITANDRYKTRIKIVCHVRNMKKAAEFLGSLIERDDVEMIISESFEIDICCDYIIHTACPTTSKFFVTSPVETIDTSINSTKQLLELARRKNIKNMVFLSSMEEYGIPFERDKIVVMTEDSCGIINPLVVRSCYPESKRLCECYCASYSSEYGVHVSIVRLAQTFGSGISLSDNRVFMQFARSAIGEKDIVLHTSGETMSNFCYVSDAIVGILTVLLKGKTSEAYNICNDGETRTVVDIAKLVAEKITGGRIKVVFDVPDSPLTYGYAPDVRMKLCSDKAKLLGWIPQVDMESAYKRLIAYIREEKC